MILFLVKNCHLNICKVILKSGDALVNGYKRNCNKKELFSLEITVKFLLSKVQFTSKLLTETNTKEVIIGFTEKFLIKNSMEMEDKMDLSFPTIKMNNVAISKLAEIEKQATEIILENIFEEIKKIIAENPKDLLIDMSQFGKLRIKDRRVMHEPNEKPKSSSISTFKKTTIKSLLQKDYPKKLPTLG